MYSYSSVTDAETTENDFNIIFDIEITARLNSTESVFIKDQALSSSMKLTVIWDRNEASEKKKKQA